MIAIVGAGAIGRLWAASLPADNCCFIDTRISKPECIEFDAYSSDEDFETIEREIRTLSMCESDEFDAVLICTKAFAAPFAASELDRHFTKDTPLFLFQNGMGSQAEIITSISDRPILAASTTDGANIQQNGSLIIAGIGETQIGHLRPSPHESTSPRESKLQKAMKTIERCERSSRFTENIWPVLWRKLIINCAINPITAIEGCTNGEIQKTETFKKHWPLLRNELSRVSSVGEIPMSEMEVEQLVLNVAKATEENLSSMLQDVLASRATEIDQINGFAVSQLRAAGFPSEINQLLTERVHALGY